MENGMLAATYLFHILTNNSKAFAGHVVVDDDICIVHTQYVGCIPNMQMGQDAEPKNFTTFLKSFCEMRLHVE